MPNSQTPRSRAKRAATATAANQAKLAAGWRRLNILIDPETAAKLDELRAEYPNKPDVIKAAIMALTKNNSAKPIDSKL